MAFVWGASHVSNGSVAAANRVPMAADLGLVASVRSAAAGYRHTLLLCGDGSVLSAGSNGDGQLGREGDPSTPSLVGSLVGTPVSAVAAGGLHSLFITQSGDVYECGLVFADNRSGHGGAVPRNAEQRALAGLVEGRSEFFRRVVLRSEAAYLANRPVSEISTEAVATGGAAGAGGLNGRAFDDVDGGAMGLDVLSTHVVRVRVPVPRPVDLLRPGVRVVAAAAGYTHSVLIDDTGSLWAAGYNDRGQCGFGTRVASATFRPVRVPPRERFVKVACGQQHSVAVTAGGCAWSWGSGALGQLGSGRTTDRLRPEPVSVEGGEGEGPRASEDGAGVAAERGPCVDVACGANHSLLLLRDGRVLGFGHSEYNQLGASRVGGSRHFYLPRELHISVAGPSGGDPAAPPPPRVAAVYAGGQFSLARLVDGRLVSWGWDSHGCLGRARAEAGRSGVAADAAMAAAGVVTGGGIDGRDVVAAACGYHHAVAVVAPRGHVFAAAWAAVLRSVNDDDPGVAGGGDAAGGGVAPGPRLWCGGADIEFVGSRRHGLGLPSMPPPVGQGAPTVQKGGESAPGIPAAAAPAGVSLGSALRRDLLEHFARLGARGAPAAADEGADGGARVSGADGVVGTAARLVGSGAIPAATAPYTPENPVRAHALIVRARCATLSEAMAAAEAAPDHVAQLSSPAPGGVSACIHRLDAPAPGRSCWRVELPGVHRPVVSALLHFLYSGDLPPTLPAHRLPQLAAVGRTLGLERLCELCGPASAGRSAPLEFDGSAGGASDVARLLRVYDEGYVADMRRLLLGGAGDGRWDSADVQIVAEPEPSEREPSAAASPCALLAHSLVLCRLEFFRGALLGGFAEGTGSTGCCESGSAPVPAACAADRPPLDSCPPGLPRVRPPTSLRTLTLPETDPAALSLVLGYIYTGDLRPCAAAGVGACLGAAALAARLGVVELQASGEEVAVALLREAEEDGSMMGDDEREAVAAFAELHGLRRLKEFCYPRHRLRHPS